MTGQACLAHVVSPIAGIGGVEPLSLPPGEWLTGILLPLKRR